MKKIIEETKKITNEAGDIKVSEKVIASVAKTAVLEVEGVKGIADEEAKINSIIDKYLNVKKGEAGIKVDVKDNAELSLEIHVVLKYGTNLIDIAKNIQEKVKDAVESIVGMHVMDVDVHVDEIETE